MDRKLKLLLYTCAAIALWHVLALPVRLQYAAALFSPPQLASDPPHPATSDIFAPPPITSPLNTTKKLKPALPQEPLLYQPQPADASAPALIPPPLEVPHAPSELRISQQDELPITPIEEEPTRADSYTDNTPQTPINPLRAPKAFRSPIPSAYSKAPPAPDADATIPLIAANDPGAQASIPSNPEQLPSGAAPASPPPEDAPKEQKPEEKKEKEKLGEEPPQSAIDIFRQSTVLLPVGVWECDLGFQYALFEDDFLTILPSSTIVPQRTSSRTYLGTLSLRYGYNEVLQPFLAVPGGMSAVETANQAFDDSNDEFGIGDVTFGASYLVRNGEDKRADVVFNLSCVAPTGQANFLSIVPGSASLGNGFWIVSPSLSWTRTFDPVVLYSTIAYLHRFEAEHFGAQIKPGEEFDIGYGAGFAINDNITYSLQFQWAHQFDTSVNDVPIANSGADVATIRQSAIIRITPKKFVEVFFANGLTDNSPQVSMGVTLVGRF